MTDLTPHMTPIERERYALLVTAANVWAEMRAENMREISKIRNAVKARLRRAAQKDAA